MDEQINKSHRKKQSGPKSRFKSLKVLDKTSLGNKHHNPKAFAIQSVNKAARLFRRGKDIETKKHHIPIVEKSEADPPPLIVSIIGPPKVGKSTLLRCLVKNFTRQNITEIKGPITIVAGKRRRITFIECNNDINCMIDLAKISDLALLLIDASFGFEMEIFEFINICQVHGFPRIMGVLTHLDHFKHVNILRKTKKKLKHRFWTEIYQGAKLFYLSGLMKDDYLKVEVHNLGRFITVMKVQNIEWRNTHSYVLVDRIEDITDPQIIETNPKCDRKVSFYGYVHGAHLKYNCDVHVAGVGDFTLDTISFLEDPCPAPVTSNSNKGYDFTKVKVMKRSLNQKERLVYAPMSGMCGLIYDKDSIYIELVGSHSHARNEKNLDSKHNVDIDMDEKSEIDSKHLLYMKPLDSKIKDIELSLFSESHPLKSHQINEQFFEPQNDPTTFEPVKRDTDGKTQFDENSFERIISLEMEQISKLNIHAPENDTNVEAVAHSKSKRYDWRIDSNDNFLSPSNQNSDFTENTITESADDLFVKKEISSKLPFFKDANSIDDVESSKAAYQDANLYRKISHEKIEIFINDNNKVNQSNIKSNINDKDSSETCFYGLVDWALFQNANLLNKRFMKVKVSSDNELNLDNEEKDARIKKKMKNKLPNAESNDKDISDDSNSNGEISDNNGEETDAKNSDNEDESQNTKEKEGPLSKKDKKIRDIKTKKLKLKARFDAIYDQDKNSFFNEMKTQVAEQSQLNKSVFSHLEEELRVKYEGHRPGMYVRIEIQGIPCEFITNHDSTYPVIIGGISPNECANGYLQARVKKHRWFERILKTRDPLILSAGWRRYQTVIVYSNEDHSGRNHMLKYTPQNLHCLANFYGPVCAQNTGILGIQNLSEGVKNFRITLTGVIINLNKSLDIVKKLKLVGVPFKIYRKTAFIQGLFNTPLEAAKFEGASVKTVSSIRGQIKRALLAPPGAVRITFEDRITMSDIIFMRTWTQVELPKLYNPVYNLLLPLESRQSWVGMKTVGQLRMGRKPDYNQDSIYKSITRPLNKEKPLYIPPTLEKSLPFNERLSMLNADSIRNISVKLIIRPDRKCVKRKKTTTYNDGLENDFKRIAVIEDNDTEIKINRLMKVAQYMHEEKKSKKMEAMKERVDKHRRDLAKIKAKQEASQKEIKKRICKSLGMAKAKKEKASRKR